MPSRQAGNNRKVAPKEEGWSGLNILSSSFFKRITSSLSLLTAWANASIRSVLLAPFTQSPSRWTLTTSRICHQQNQEAELIVRAQDEGFAWFHDQGWGDSTDEGGTEGLRNGRLVYRTDTAGLLRIMNRPVPEQGYFCGHVYGPSHFTTRWIGLRTNCCKNSVRTQKK